MSFAESLTRINRDNGQLGALAFVDPAPLPGVEGVLADLTVSVKDVIDVRGWPITCNHRPFRDRRSTCDAAVVEGFRRNGASLVGASATLEFAYGGYSDGALYSPARNPWALDRSPGGSSCGAGAAVAAGLCDIAIATDTSGSVREPAALCGVLGLKPSHGSISVDGVYPLAPSLDVVGLLARDAQVLAKAASVALRRKVELEPFPVRIGWLHDFDKAAGVVPGVKDALEASFRLLQKGGVSIEAIKVGHGLRDYHKACIISLLTEAWNIHGYRLRTERDGYDPLTWSRLALGGFVPQAAYIDAMNLRRDLRSEIDAALNSFDLLATAGAPAPAEPLDEIGPFGMLHQSFLTSPFSATGHPALVIPIGFDRSGLPLAMQLIAPHGQEQRLIAAAELCQSLAIYRPNYNKKFDLAQRSAI